MLTPHQVTRRLRAALLLASVSCQTTTSVSSTSALLAYKADLRQGMNGICMRLASAPPVIWLLAQLRLPFISCRTAPSETYSSHRTPIIELWLKWLCRSFVRLASCPSHPRSFPRFRTDICLLMTLPYSISEMRVPNASNQSMKPLLG